jgi:hypothetical protein
VGGVDSTTRNTLSRQATLSQADPSDSIAPSLYGYILATSSASIMALEANCM